MSFQSSFEWEMSEGTKVVASHAACATRFKKPHPFAASRQVKPALLREQS
jgi:hypothetical protein